MPVVRSRRTRFALAALVAGSLTVAACGSEAPVARDATSTTVEQALRPIFASNDGSKRSGTMSAGADADAPASESASDQSIRMAWLRYVVEGQLAELPMTGTAYVFERTGEMSIERVQALAAAFGLTDTPVRASEDMGGGWQVGPNDGTAASLTVYDNALGDWYYSPAWNDGSDVKMMPCAIEEPVLVDPAVEPAVDPVAPDDKRLEETPADTPASDSVGSGSSDGSGGEQACETPAPPENIPSEDEARALATALLAATGVDTANYDLEVYSDEWGASVTAWLLVDGVRAPVANSFGFGENGALTWAGGTLTTPTAVGDYPLVGVNAGVDRLNAQQEQWMRGDFGYAETLPAVDPAATETVGGDVAVSSDDARGTKDIDVDAGEPMDVVITGVKSDLTMIWDVDDTVWLLPAYTYSNADGVVATIAAVTDEYLMEPDPIDVPVPDTVPAVSIDVPVTDAPTPPPSDAPLPTEPATTVPAEPVSTEPAVSEPAQPTAPDVVGLSQADAEAAAVAAGLTVRIVEIDGVGQAVTDDLRTDRLNLSVNAGVVTAAEIY